MPLSPTYTTTVDLALVNSEIVISSISATKTQLTATSFMSGPQGLTGATGSTGPGVSAGGTSGQVLAKNSSTDFDTHWVAAGSGTVTSASVVSANGLAGTIANPTTTPAITLSTTLTGIVKGNGTALSAAAAGTDYLAPAGSGAALTGLTESQVTNLTTDLAAKAPLASPALTGTPTAPTQTASDNSTRLATTAYTTTAILNAATTYDDVLDFANLAAFPATGATGILYIANDTSFIYRWGGSSYTPVGGVTSGTVTSVAVSGGTTGLTTSGGPITGSGTITMAGTLAVANGGTGNTSGQPSGVAGGDLTGTYPNPTISNTANFKSLVATDSLPLIIALG